MILASLVEKETGASWERATIASVFHNRLQIGMKFQSDPTILYGMLRNTGVMPTNIRKKDILKKTAIQYIYSFWFSKRTDYQSRKRGHPCCVEP